MKTLPAGPVKYLLIDNNTVARNAERSAGVVAPVAIVLLTNDEGVVISRHAATKVDIKGESSLTYSQHAPLFRDRDLVLRAAFSTTAEVVLDADAASTEEPAAPAPKPSTSAKPKKPARVTNIATEE